ncbi:thiamine diphosphokinase [Anaerocolumna sedimenticola]|uniref:Thiamine diphosphokinase n=1 Tax=Anaerocolumna sedimenticola TaxID=2696063 RepID=A0A6P1TR90_9FIRM|nr:thiamine diphosphokinase [Anaerocolumna sedimenticola]QHQ62045.1 thiamine diphosphokinase [Anaerocolumna sedimenticola]
MKENRILIITGGAASIDFVREFLIKNRFDTIIAVDSGLVTASKLGIPLQYIVGDFDSVPRELIESYRNDKSVIINEFNPEKDATDTHIALSLGLELNGSEIVILGATGTRIDHMLANIHLLYLPLNKNIKASIIDEHNKIYMINKSTAIYKNKLFGPFVSLQPFTEVVKGITLKGFKYPLNNYTMLKGDSIGTSNEVVEEQADISLEDGILIVIEARD